MTLQNRVMTVSRRWGRYKKVIYTFLNPEIDTDRTVMPQNIPDYDFLPEYESGGK